MTDREKVTEILEKAKTIIENWVPMFEQYNTPAGIDDAIVLLKEQEEQKQKWLKQIAYAQIAVCPTGNETEEGFAKRTGEWNGLQMAWDILTKGR